MELVLLVAASFAVAVNATAPDTFLCVAEEGAAVGRSNYGEMTSTLIDVSQKKYILSKENGRWQVKELGKDYVLFDNCTSQYHCQRSDSYAGVFQRFEDSGTFVVNYMTKTDSHFWHAVAGGRCSSI